MQNPNVNVGLFVIGGLILFGAGMFLIGDRRQAFGEHVEYFAGFSNLAGLSKGAKVRVGGLDAGEVMAIDVPDSPASRFRVRWRVAANLRGLVRNDSLATIDTEGVVGGTYLSVRPGTARAPQAAALATVPSREPTELAELLEQGSGLIDDAHSIMKDIDGKLGGALVAATSTLSNVNDIAVGLKQGRGAAGMLLSDDALAKQLRQSATSTASNLDDIVAGVKAGRGPAGILLRDEAVAAQLRDAMKNAQQATADLGHASHQADALISDLGAQQIPQKAAGVVDNLNDSAHQVSRMIAEINQPDRQGVSAAANIREALTNANAATLNLADDSEALKHNFLLRGFFKRRGYYNLDRLPPEQYRRDSAATSRANSRAWLAAPDLFQEGANGQEEISPAGKTMLDDALTKNGDSIFESPLVIEGYCTSRTPADQLRLSRARAVLVRQYLQARFQLDAGNLGAVALNSAPPNGIGRATWDGVCVVLIRKK
jgi:phospholipid/cholesterol/gamma-HCH transport system substrate-binding protein